MIMYEHFFQCPFCWENVSIMLDPSVPAQSYYEDCQVCCNPLEITVRFEQGDLTEFSVLPV